MISEQQFAKSAAVLNVDVAAIKAVAEVESRGDGFLPDGKAKILFEPHIFWKELRVKAIRPELFMEENEDILYPKWKAGAYGPVSVQHDRMTRAAKINREAALRSSSWGRFQVMGFNWKTCGCTSLEDFVAAMSLNEDEHLKLFTAYIRATHLDDELRGRDWAGFALAYNGPMYRKNRYDIKLKAAYLKFSGLVTA